MTDKQTIPPPGGDMEKVTTWDQQICDEFICRLEKPCICGALRACRKCRETPESPHSPECSNCNGSGTVPY